MKWREMSVLHKIISVARLFFSFSAIVLCLLDAAGVLEKGLNCALLLLGINNILSGMDNWKKQKGLAIFELTGGAFMIIVELFILLF